MAWVKYGQKQKLGYKLTCAEQMKQHSIFMFVYTNKELFYCAHICTLLPNPLFFYFSKQKMYL